jgi:glycopeptide antibiotics resistance protein
MKALCQIKVGMLLFSLVYFLILIYLLFFAFFRENTTTEVNLIPFKNIYTLTVYTFTSGHGIWHWIVNVPGNIIAFIPMALPIFLIRKSFTITFLLILFILILPICIEFLQYVFQSGSADIDDVILNAIGTFCGIYILKKIKKQPTH